MSYDSRDTVPGRRRSRGLRDAATGTPPGSTLGHHTGVRHLPALSTPRGLFHEVAIGKIVLKYKSQSRLATLPKFAFFLVRGRRGADRARLCQSPGPGRCPRVQGSDLQGVPRSDQEARGDKHRVGRRGAGTGRDVEGTGAAGGLRPGRSRHGCGRKAESHLPVPGVSAGLGPKRQEKEKKDAGAAEPRAPQGSQTTLCFSSCPTF